MRMRNLCIRAAALAQAMLVGVVFINDAKAGIKNQNGKLDLEIYGIITRTLLYVDDGDKHQLFHVDGGVENTRLGYAVNGQLTEDIAVGGVFEYDIGLSNPAGDATLGANGESSPY